MTNHGGKREGAGRKPRTDGRKRRLVSVNLTDEEYSQVMGLDIEKRREQLMVTLTDRVAQVDYIDRAAQEMTSADVTLADYNGDVEALANDAVDNLFDLPEWWNEHDTNLFKLKVREYITS
jgi:hypothetical protein